MATACLSSTAFARRCGVVRLAQQEYEGARLAGSERSRELQRGAGIETRAGSPGKGDGSCEGRRRVEGRSLGQPVERTAVDRVGQRQPGDREPSTAHDDEGQPGPTFEQLGAKVRVPTLDGAVELAIPANTSGGRTFRLKGKGLPKAAGAAGDLFVTTRIMLPDGNDAELESLMLKWREGRPYNPRSDLG